MNIAQLTPILAPLLPYLLQGGIELAKSAAARQSLEANEQRLSELEQSILAAAFRGEV